MRSPHPPPRTHAMAVALAATIIALASGCSDDTVAPPGTPPVQTAWRVLGDLPTIYSLNAVHATGPGEFVAVGPQGLVVHYDGATWTPLYTEATADLWAVWGTSFDDLVAVGDNGVVIQNSGQGFLLLPSPTDEHLRGVWGTRRDDFYVVGEQGYIFHYDGNVWTPMESNAVRALLSVWGSGPDDIFACGVGGTVVHYDGVGWSPMNTGTTETLACIHGASGDAVIAVGNHGTIIRYDGQSWQPHASGTTDVTAVGSRVVMRYDGSEWAAITKGSVPTMWGVWSPASGQAFAVGARGTVLRYANERWTSMRTPTTRGMNAVWGLSGTDVYAVGNAGRVMHLVDNEWFLELTIGANYQDISGTAPDNIWIVGQDGRVIHKGEQLIWATVRNVTTHTLYSVWNDTPEVMVGANGEIIEFDGMDGQRRASPTNAILFDVDGYIDEVFGSTLYAYAVGLDGVIVRRVPETGEWRLMESGVDVALFAVGRGPDDAMYAGGAGGVVLRLAGDTWEPFECPTQENIFSFSRGACGLSSKRATPSPEHDCRDSGQSSVLRTEGG